MQTDFAGMGLNPEGSYIIVVHGEDPTATNSNARTGGDDIVVDDGDLPAGSSHFEYMYNGSKYYMRYSTVLNTGHDEFEKNSTYIPTEEPSYFATVFGNIFSTALVAAADSATDKYHIGTIASVFFDVPEDHSYTELSPGDFGIYASTTWTCEFIEVWDSLAQKWEPSLCSDYTTSMVYGFGSMRNPLTNKPVPVIYDPIYFNTYSLWYFDVEQRKLFAMKAYERYRVDVDGVGYVNFYVVDETGEIITNPQGELLFRHVRTTAVVLP